MAEGTCSLDGCERAGKITYGWCQAHYRRWKKHGDPGSPNVGERRVVEPGQLCAVVGCLRTERLKRGWCTPHYARWRDSGDPGGPEIQDRIAPDAICATDGCIAGVLARGLCSLHYQRVARTGTSDPRPRVDLELCSVPECESKRIAKGLCRRHYRANSLYGDPSGSAPKSDRPTECIIEGCRKAPVARGWCMTHHARWRFHGDPHAVDLRPSKADRGLCEVYRCIEPVETSGRCSAHHRRRENYRDLCAKVAALDEVNPGDEDLSGRFFARVEKTDTCWLWTGYVNDHGYGLFAILPRIYRPAHRVAWRLSGRSLRVGMHLDHLCRVRNCVRPNHLEQVAPAINVRRGIGPSGINYRKTACKRGHEFDLINTAFTSDGSRKCRTCTRLASKARHHGLRIDEYLLASA